MYMYIKFTIHLTNAQTSLYLGCSATNIVEYAQALSPPFSIVISATGSGARTDVRLLR